MSISLCVCPALAHYTGFHVHLAARVPCTGALWLTIPPSHPTVLLLAICVSPRHVQTDQPLWWVTGDLGNGARRTASSSFAPYPTRPVSLLSCSEGLSI